MSETVITFNHARVVFAADEPDDIESWARENNMRCPVCERVLSGAHGDREPRIICTAIAISPTGAEFGRLTSARALCASYVRASVACGSCADSLANAVAPKRSAEIMDMDRALRIISRKTRGRAGAAPVVEFPPMSASDFISHIIAHEMTTRVRLILDRKELRENGAVAGEIAYVCALARSLFCAQDDGRAFDAIKREIAFAPGTAEWSLFGALAGEFAVYACDDEFDSVANSTSPARHPFEGSGAGAIYSGGRELSVFETAIVLSAQIAFQRRAVPPELVCQLMRSAEDTPRIVFPVQVRRARDQKIIVRIGATFGPRFVLM